MNIDLGFGTGVQSVTLPDENVLAVLEANPLEYKLTGMDEVRRALREPIGAAPLRDIVRAGETVAIVTSDITRPCPTWKMLPPVLEELFAAGIRPEDITVTFALGSHRAHTEEEHKKLMGESYGLIACRDSDGVNCTHLGVTKRGTPVDIDTAVASADRRICFGNIEYHYFAGYSGGAKAIMPGVSTRAAISLLRASQASALLDGRDYVSPEDVRRMAEPVLAHRLVLSPEARMRNMTAERILGNVIGSVPVPVKVK